MERDRIADDTGLPDAGGVDVTHLTGARHARRAREHRAAQHALRALVDYLGEAALAHEPPVAIGEVAKQVVARSAAVASARQFIAACEAVD